jgi:hypothetical protein
MTAKISIENREVIRKYLSMSVCIVVYLAVIVRRQKFYKTSVVHTNFHLMRYDLDADNMLFVIQGKMEGRIDVEEDVSS